jgi:hypothetical protein
MIAKKKVNKHPKGSRHQAGISVTTLKFAKMAYPLLTPGKLLKS